MTRLAVFASGGGSNLQAIIDACQSGRLPAQVKVVISDKRDAFALQRAKDAGIPAFHFGQFSPQPKEALERAIVETLRAHKVQLVFLAGYLKKVGPGVLAAYEGRIFNIHPSLLPKYGGRGMYGIHVHKAVLAAGDPETGVTIHRVNAAYDEGAVVAQKKVPVQDGDTPETLAARVLVQEHLLIVEVLGEILEFIDLFGN